MNKLDQVESDLAHLEDRVHGLMKIIETLQALAKQHDTAITAIADIMEGKNHVQPLS